MRVSGRKAGRSAEEEGEMDGASSSGSLCDGLHQDVASFIDAFVDFSVSGLFFTQPSRVTPPQTRHPSPNRLVAIGDLHGDLSKSLQSLVLARLIDPLTLRWVAGSTTAVQVGDVLDRGADEIQLIYYLHRLKQDAISHGGALFTMLGNHEIMNISSDFRFADSTSLPRYENWASWYQSGCRMKNLCPQLGAQQDIYRGIPKRLPGIRQEFQAGFRARIAALRPEGPISRRFLSDNPTVLVIGDSVFVHGGLLNNHVSYGLERINNEVMDWIKGLNGRLPPLSVQGRNSVVWLRQFSLELEHKCDCTLLEHVLETIPGARRMIMGHTIQQKGINGVCENRAIRIDVGLSKGCKNGLPEVLEINEDPKEIRILSSRATPRMDNPMMSESTAETNFGAGFFLGGRPAVQVDAKA